MYDGDVALSQFDFHTEVAEAIITKLPNNGASGKKAKSSPELAQRLDQFGHDVIRFETLSRYRQCNLKHRCRLCPFKGLLNNVAPDKTIQVQKSQIILVFFIGREGLVICLPPFFQYNNKYI